MVSPSSDGEPTCDEGTHPEHPGIPGQSTGRGGRMAQKHKWADVIIAMANGETAQTLDSYDNWFDPGQAFMNPMTHPGFQWRIKPRTIMIGDMEVPEPLREIPMKGTKIYWVDLGNPKNPPWEISDPENWRDVNLSHLGILHLTKEAAITHAKALIKISGGTA